MNKNLVERFCVLKDKNAEGDILAAALNIKSRYMELTDAMILPNDVKFYPNGKTIERKIYGLKILINYYPNGNKVEYEMSIEYKHSKTNQLHTC